MRSALKPLLAFWLERRAQATLHREQHDWGMAICEDGHLQQIEVILNRRNKIEKQLLEELELHTMSGVNLGRPGEVPMVTVDPRRNQSSPPVFFDCKLFPRPYALEITSSGVIENVDPGVALDAGVRRGDSVVRIGRGPAQWSDFVARDGVSSSLVVSNIVSMPEEATWIKFARGRNYRCIHANGTVEVGITRPKVYTRGTFPMIAIACRTLPCVSKRGQSAFIRTGERYSHGASLPCPK